MSDLRGILAALKVITKHFLAGDRGPAPDNGTTGRAVDIAPTCGPVSVTDGKVMLVIESMGISDDEVMSSSHTPKQS
jgi:hypothetical protein